MLIELVKIFWSRIIFLDCVLVVASLVLTVLFLLKKDKSTQCYQLIEDGKTKYITYSQYHKHVVISIIFLCIFVLFLILSPNTEEMVLILEMMSK